MGSLTSVENHCSTEAPLASSSDIHSPRFLPLFRKALAEYNNESTFFFVLAGDIVDKGVIEAAQPVFKAILEKYSNVRIISVFGNEEYHDRESEFRKRYPFIVWLNDEYVVYECGNSQIAFIGTRGALDRPTRWQRKHMPWLEKVYRERPIRIKELIYRAKKEADYIIVVSHYAVSRATIIGEPRSFWPEIYSSRMEKTIIETKPDAVIHGHAHNGKPFALVSGVRIYNVALPLNRRIVPVFLRKRGTSILDWLEKS